MPKSEESIDDILAEMRMEGEYGDVTTGIRRAYAIRIERALRKHDTELVAYFAQAFVASIMKREEGGDHA